MMGGLTEARQLLRQHLVSDPVRILLMIILQDAIEADVHNKRTTNEGQEA